MRYDSPVFRFHWVGHWPGLEVGPVSYTKLGRRSGDLLRCESRTFHFGERLPSPPRRSESEAPESLFVGRHTHGRVRLRRTGASSSVRVLQKRQ